MGDQWRMQAHMQLARWLEATEAALDDIHVPTIDESTTINKTQIERALTQLRLIHADIAAHVPSFEALERVGATLDATTRPMLDELLKRWTRLNVRAQALNNQLEEARAAANSRTNQLDR